MLAAGTIKTKLMKNKVFLYLRSLVRLSLQFSLRLVKTGHVFLLAFSCWFFSKKPMQTLVLICQHFQRKMVSADCSMALWTTSRLSGMDILL